MYRKMFGAAILVCVGMSGCSSAVKQHEALLDEAVVVMREFATVMESIQDPASAQAAATRIDEITKKLEDLHTRGQALPKISVEENRQLEQKMKAEEQSLKARIEKVAPQALNKAGANAPMVGQALQRMAATAQKFQKFSGS